MRDLTIWLASALCVAAFGCQGPSKHESSTSKPTSQPTAKDPTPPAPPVHAAVGKGVIATPPNSEYPARGVQSLIDGRMGSDDHYDAEWMGWWYEDKPFEATIDLGMAMPITELAVHALTSSESWILLPRKIEFEVSADGAAFDSVATVEPTKVDLENEYPETKMLEAKGLAVEARYVRVRAQRYGELPRWHMGHGGADGYEGQAWLFIDEILVNPTK